MRDRRPGSMRMYGLPFPVCGVAADGRVDGAAVVFEHSGHHGLINAGEGVILQLRRQKLMRGVVFCGDQKSGCVLVNAVDNTRPLHAADP